MGLTDFFSAPDPTAEVEPTDEPGKKVLEDGTPGEPGHNILTLDEPDVDDVPLTAEQGEALYADTIKQAQDAQIAAWLDAENKYLKDTQQIIEAAPEAPEPNPLSVESTDTESNLASRENIVSPDETISEDRESALRAKSQVLADVLTQYNKEITSYEDEIAAAEKLLAPTRDALLEAREGLARVQDEFDEIQAVLADPAKTPSARS